jgi:hypothetical protein
MTNYSRKGQIGLIGIVFALIMFFLLWGLFLAGWLRDVTTDFIVNNELTGIEAFLVSNINLWIFSGLLIGIVAVAYLGGRG